MLNNTTSLIESSCEKSNSISVTKLPGESCNLEVDLSDLAYIMSHVQSKYEGKAGDQEHRKELQNDYENKIKECAVIGQIEIEVIKNTYCVANCNRDKFSNVFIYHKYKEGTKQYLVPTKIQEGIIRYEYRTEKGNPRPSGIDNFVKSIKDDNKPKQKIKK